MKRKKREIKSEKKKYCKRGMNLRLTEGEEKISLMRKGRCSPKLTIHGWETSLRGKQSIAKGSFG